MVADIIHICHMYISKIYVSVSMICICSPPFKRSPFKGTPVLSPGGPKPRCALRGQGPGGGGVEAASCGPLGQTTGLLGPAPYVHIHIYIYIYPRVPL